MGKRQTNSCKGNNNEEQVMIYEVTNEKEKKEYNFNHCCYYRYMWDFGICCTLHL